MDSGWVKATANEWIRPFYWKIRMRFKTGDSMPTIICRATIARMAKERGLTLNDNELQVIKRFLNVMDRPIKDRRSNNQIGASDAEFLESLGIRL